MSENQKKLLANQIKKDLRKDLTEAEKAIEHYHKSWERSMGQGCSEPRGNELRIWYNGPVETAFDKEKAKASKGGIFPEELEDDDWNEITGLIQQIDYINDTIREKEKQEQKEREVKKDWKLKSNSKCFFYEGLREWDYFGDDIRHAFLGIENGQRFWLILPEKHPAISNLPDHKEFPNKKQDRIFYLVEGVENIPLQSEEDKLCPFKKVGLSDSVIFAEYKENVDNPEKPKIELSAENKKILKMVGGVVGALIFMVIIGLWLKGKNKIKIFRKR